MHYLNEIEYKYLSGPLFYLIRRQFCDLFFITKLITTVLDLVLLFCAIDTWISVFCFVVTHLCSVRYAKTINCWLSSTCALKFFCVLICLRKYLYLMFIAFRLVLCLYILYRHTLVFNISESFILYVPLFVILCICLWWLQHVPEQDKCSWYLLKICRS